MAACLAYILLALIMHATLMPAPCLAASSLRGSGASFPFLFYSDWFFAYGFQNSVASVSYQATGSREGRQMLFAGETDFAGSDSPISVAEAEAHPDVVLLPFLAGPVVVLFNLPEVEAVDGQLILSLDILASIFLGKVRRWNDAVMIELNPDLKDVLPAAPISLIVRSDSSGSTEIFTSALSVASQDFREAIGPVTSFSDLPVNDVVRVAGSLSVYALTQQRPYALGYSSFSLVREFGGSFAPIRLSTGEVATPNRASVDIAMDQARFDEANRADLTVIRGGYPIIGFTYLLFNKSGPCTKNFAFARMVRWTLISELAQQRAESLGFSPLSPKLQDLVLNDILGPLECDGLGLLEPTAADQHAGEEYLISFIISEVVMGVCVLLAVVGLLMRLSNINASVVITNMSLILGILMNAASLVFFHHVPDESLVCQLRLWLCGLGFTILMSVLFARAIETVFIYHRSRTLRRAHGALLQKLLVASILSVFLMQASILTLWTTIDAYSTDTKEEDMINITFSYNCYSELLWMWALMEALLFFCVAFWGLVVVYITWHSHSLESKWILFTLYNVIALGAALVPLFIALHRDDDTEFFLFLVGVTVGTACLVCGMIVPNLVNRVRKLASSGTVNSRRASSLSASHAS